MVRGILKHNSTRLLIPLPAWFRFPSFFSCYDPGEKVGLQHWNKTHHKVEEWFPVRLLQISVFISCTACFHQRKENSSLVSVQSKHLTTSPKARRAIPEKTRWQPWVPPPHHVNRSESSLKTPQIPHPNLAPSGSEFNNLCFICLDI